MSDKIKLSKQRHEPKVSSNKTAFLHDLKHTLEHLDYLYQEIEKADKGELRFADWNWTCTICGEEHTGVEFSS